jgi:pyruvate ferredoxin oxidoreductase beta subunit
LGWGSEPAETVRMARLAQRTGLFPVFEAEHGEVTSVLPIRDPLPVEAYLRPQRRFAHLFTDPPQSELIARIQRTADRTIERYHLLAAPPPNPPDGR